jgi:hypothetical protein
MNDDPEDSEALVSFLQAYAPKAAEAGPDLEAQLMAGIHQEKRKPAIPSLSVALLGLIAASLLGFIMMKTRSCDQVISLESYLERSWTGINVQHEDPGFQFMLSELDDNLMSGQ